MTPEQMMGMIRAGHDVEHVMDIHLAEGNAEFRVWLMRESGPEAVARYDARIKDIESGVYGARMAWHSISEAQRFTLEIASTTKCLRRRYSKPSFYVRDGGVSLVCRIPTLRALCAHGLLSWDGGAFDPEAAAVITERGQFVLQHGPVGK